MRARAEIQGGTGDALDVAFVWRLNGKRIEANGDSVVLAEANKGDTLEVTAGNGRAGRKIAVAVLVHDPYGDAAEVDFS